MRTKEVVVPSLLFWLEGMHRAGASVWEVEPISPEA